MQFNLPFIALLLVVIGAINWGTISLLNMDLVKLVKNEQIEKIVKILVGAAGVYILFAQLNNRVMLA